MADFDGVAKKAKTKGKQLGTSGPTEIGRAHV